MRQRSTPRLLATTSACTVLFALLICPLVAAQESPAEPTTIDTTQVRTDTLAVEDSLKIVVPLDGENEPVEIRQDTTLTQLPDTTKLEPPHRRIKQINDSLLAILFSDWQTSPTFPDLPQHTSRWQLDPHFYRLSVGMWGDFETFYPLGLPPSYLSRTDNLVGGHSFANPVPVPGSEEFIRIEVADSYYFLAPALSGIYAPFGRALSVRQQRNLRDSDTARAEVFVTRGRGAFSNTTFTFQNYFGKIGNINADGTFQKTDGLVFGSDSKLDRMTFVIEPALGRNLETSVLFSFSRLKGSRVFFADDFKYSGFHTDNYSVLSLSSIYYPSDDASYSARLSYKNDDQKFDSGTLRTAQRFRLVEGSAQHQRSVGDQLLTLGGDLRFLRFSQDPNSAAAFYYNIFGSNLWTLTDQLSLFAHGALRGSEEIKPDPAVTGVIHFGVSEGLSLSGIVSHGAVLPQPEMQYVNPVAASFDGDSLVDYRLLGNEDLEIGVVESIEGILNWSSSRVKAQVRGGYSRLGDVAAWQVSYDSLANGEFSANELDRNLLFATAQTRVQITNRLHIDAAVGSRHVEEDDTDLTAGPAVTGSVLGWYVLPIRKWQVDLTLGMGGKFRTDGNPYLVGAGEDGVFVTDAYLSFDLKKFHFFFNFTNIFDLYYTLNGLQQPGRSVWWGFKWAFDN